MDLQLVVRAPAQAAERDALRALADKTAECALLKESIDMAGLCINAQEAVFNAKATVETAKKQVASPTGTDLEKEFDDFADACYEHTLAEIRMHEVVCATTTLKRKLSARGDDSGTAALFNRWVIDKLMKLDGEVASIGADVKDMKKAMIAKRT